MLIGIDPQQSADLLHCLSVMGHCDEFAIVDANFPAAACAARLVRLDGDIILTKGVVWHFAAS